MNALPHFINKIERVLVTSLANATIIPGTGVILPVDITREEIAITGLGEWSISPKNDKGSALVTVKISATIPELLVMTRGYVAYLVTEMSGDCYLVGLNEPPYCQESVEWDADAKPSGKASGTLNVSYSGRYYPLKVLN